MIHRSPTTLPRGTLFVFALPAVLQGFMHAPAQALVQSIYAKETTLAVAALGAVVIAARLLDAFTDPAIGAISDAWFRRTGSRKPLVVLGTAVNLVGLWFLYRPPADVSLAYFTIWSIVYYLGWSITEIPYRAWSLELATEHVARNRIQVWVGIALMVGTFSFYFVPYLGKTLRFSDSTELDFRVLSLSAFLIAALAPLGTALAIWRVPNGKVAVERRRVPLRELWRALRGNAPLLYFCAVVLLGGLLTSVSQSAFLLFADTYLGIGPQFAMVMMLMLPATLIAIPFWGWVCNHFERHHVWAVSMSVAGLLMGSLGFLAPGAASLVPFAVIAIGTIFMISAVIVVAPAVLGDIVDYGRWKFHEDHAAIYSAVFTLLQKLVLGVGLGGGFLVLGAFGYDASASSQTESGILGMKLAASWLPGLGLLAVAPLMWRFPIDRAAHARMIAEIEVSRS